MSGTNTQPDTLFSDVPDRLPWSAIPHCLTRRPSWTSAFAIARH